MLDCIRQGKLFNSFTWQVYSTQILFAQKLISEDELTGHIWTLPCRQGNIYLHLRLEGVLLLLFANTFNFTIDE